MKSRMRKKILCGIIPLIMICALVVPVANVSAKQTVTGIQFCEYYENYNYNSPVKPNTYAGGGYSGGQTKFNIRINTIDENGKSEFHYASGNEVIYKSDNPYVAKVDNNGVVTRVSVGVATITATTTDGSNKTASIYVNVDEYNNAFNWWEKRSWPIEYQGNTFTKDSDAKTIRCYDSKGQPIINQFVCDGTYTYFFQLDGTAMRDRLSYHPDGVHVIYLDEYGHEVFSDFHYVGKSIAGEKVNDYCFFNVYGYMYVNVLTYDKNGRNIYYANPYGVLEVNKWFQFDPRVIWADGTPAYGYGYQYGFADSGGRLITNRKTQDWLGRWCYLQGNGVALY